MVTFSPAGRGNLDSRLGDLLRSLTDRIRNLETRQQYALGTWVIKESPEGDLIAFNPTAGVTKVLATLTEEED